MLFALALCVGFLVLWPHPKRGFLTRENIQKSAEFTTPAEFEQLFGPPNSSDTGSMELLREPARILCWEDTVTEDGVTYDRTITVAFNLKTGELISSGEGEAIHQTVWEGIRDWMRTWLW
jgi:hypothetical protein